MKVTSKFKYIYNEEAERSLIIQLLAETSNLRLCADRIPQEAINNELYRTIYSKCLMFKDNPQDLSLDELSLKLKHDWGEESANVKNLKNFLMEGTIMSFNEALMKVEKGYYKRMILDKLEFIQHNLLTTNDIEKTISEGYSNILSLISKLKSFNIQTENPLLDLVNDLGTNDNRKSSILSNLSKLDKLTNGIPRGHLTIIGGRSSMGKSAFAFNLLLNFLNKGLKCTFFSLETSHRYLIYRLLSIKCRMNYDKVINRIFNQKETQDLKDFVNLVNYWFNEKLLSIYDDYMPYSKLELLVRQNKDNIDVVFIDYLQIIALSDKKATYLELNEIMAKLKMLAKELNISIIILSQLSRGVDNREDHWPQLSDLSYSGGIENAADLIMLLYRSDYYTDRAAANNKPGVITTNSFDNNTKDRNKLNVIVAKNRNGPVGNVRVFFDPVSGEVSDLLTE